MKYKPIIFYLILHPIILFGEIQYSHNGYFDLGTIHRLSDGTIIKVPYRMITFEPALSYNNFSFISNFALEFRLNDLNDITSSKFIFDYRELYFEWITEIGEFSIGKQIISWGLTSANSPTDIISPYNYYYLFSKGKEKKEGSFLLNSNLYFNTFKINLILIPSHFSNIIPFNDSELPIELPIEDPTTNEPLTILNEQIMDLEQPIELGISLTFPIKSFDLSTSYFTGYDRNFSFFGANLWTGSNSNPDAIQTDIVLSYRKTNMLGFGFSSVINNFVIKGDFALFNTDDDINNITDSTLYRYWPSGVNDIIEQCKFLNETSAWDPDFQIIDCSNDAKFNNSEVIDNRAEYFQYTLELEYSPSYDFSIISQLSVSKLNKIGIADSIRTSRETIMFDPLNYFIPGIGLPNTFISENSLTIIAQKIVSNLNLTINAFSILDLNNKGSINELNFEYNLNDNTKLFFALNKIFYNEKIAKNPLQGMSDFSHARLEIKKFF